MKIPEQRLSPQLKEPCEITSTSKTTFSVDDLTRRILNSWNISRDSIRRPWQRGRSRERDVLGTGMGREDQGSLLRAKSLSKMAFEKDHSCNAWLVLIKSQVVDAQLFIGSSSGCFCCLTKFIDGALVEPPANVLWTVAGLQGFPLWDINLHKTPLRLCFGKTNSRNLCTFKRLCWGRLQKERASAKAPPSRPVHKELKI